MDRHEQFMQHRTMDVKNLLIRNTTNYYLSVRLVKCFNGVVRDLYKFSDTAAILETLRTVLCLFYQESSIVVIPTVAAAAKSIFKFEKINVNEIQDALYTQLDNVEFLDCKELSLVLDILVLHMVVNCDVTAIVHNLEELHDSIGLDEDDKGEILHMKLLDCYIDTFLLRKKKSSIDEVNNEKLTNLFLDIVKSWLTLQDYEDFAQLTQRIPNLMKVVDVGGKLTEVWEMIFTLNNGKILSTLHLTAAAWLPEELDHGKELLGRTMEERLWLLLHKELSSLIPKQREQAFQLIAKIVDFVDKHRTQGLQSCNYKEIRPLICIGTESQQDLFKKNLNNFFSVLNALDQPKEHFVTPGFQLLKNLLNETHHLHGFHIAWIRCVFSRILQDSDNSSVVKWGLLEVLTLDLELYDDEFLSVVLHALNNTSLYEDDMDREELAMVKELSIFLNCAATKRANLLIRFMEKASKMIWNPVPLFYVIHALFMLKKVKSIWKESELAAVKSLAEIILPISCPILRIGSQIELLETMIRFATESMDLIAIANTLSAFSTSEVLIRRQLVWKKTSAWLARVVEKHEAIHFIENVCEQLTNENSQKDLSMKSLSILIMLFYDEQLVFDSQLCPGRLALWNLLKCSIGADSGTKVSAEVGNKSIDLVHYLMDLTSSNDYVLRELISDYTDVILRFTFKNLRHMPDTVCAGTISTYTSVIQQFFTTKTGITAQKEILNHMERFEIESWSIIEDEEWSNNVRRLFGIKVLHACLTNKSVKLRNYKFIGPMRKTYKIPMTQSTRDTEEANKTHPDEIQNQKHNETALEYYKFVAKLFYEYLKDNPVDEWLPNVNWIEEVSYLIQVGGKDIFAPLIGILAQIFHKEAVKATDLEDFKSVLGICWKSTLESKEYWSTMEEIIDVIFSSAFLECKETQELAIEWTHEIVDKQETNPELRLIFLNGLKRVNGEYIGCFYGMILTCLLHRCVSDHDKRIELQACSYILNAHRDVYPDYQLSHMNVDTDVAVRAHAVILLHKMITDDPTHATKLLPLIVGKLNESQKKPNLDDLQSPCIENRIMQILLVLQPILTADDMGSLYTLLWDNLSSKCYQPSVRIMQEWLLIRISLQNETLRSKIWDPFDLGQDKLEDTISSTVIVVYHVARLLSSYSQLDFINLAFQYIMPCCMSHELNVRWYAQAITSKLYDLASEMNYSTVTERYKDFYSALTKSSKNGKVVKTSAEFEDVFYFTAVDPIGDYSLETIFYTLPKLPNIYLDKYIRPQMFEKFGFKVSNSHPLKVFNSWNNAIGGSAEANGSDGSSDCCNEEQH